MVDFDKKILDSSKFTGPARHFQTHGVYCFAPPGTTEYDEYWEKEQHRCINGYTTEDGDWMSGYNYFYLNYCPILRLVELTYKDRHGAIKKRRERVREFPDFYDYDYYYFSGIEMAEEEGKHMVVLKARGKGYEQPYSELVATPDGFKEMGSLKEGDLVMNPDGMPTEVIQIHEHGFKDVYEVTFDDGRTVRCGEEHLWQLTDVQSRGKKSVIKRTRDLVHEGLFKTYDGYNHYRYYIEPISEVNYAEKTYDIDPYILGALLGDGDITDGNLKISTKDEEIVREFERILGDDYSLNRDYTSFNYNISVTNKRRFDSKKNSEFENYKYGVNPLRRYIDKLGLNVGCADKFIPEEYKYGSIEQRYELIRGLMDTDGYCSVDGSIEFTNTSKQLIEDTALVLRSLGIRCEIGIDSRPDKFSYRLHIRTSNPIFKLKRKLDRLNHTKKINSKVALISIKRLDYQEQSRCITVSHENSLYLTRGYIPTHNSFKGASMLVRNFYHIPESKSYAIAAETAYLVGDGIITKAWDLMDFIDEHTAWAKKRQAVNTKLHRRASILTTDEMGNKIEIGYKSEIIGISLKNDPNRARGKRGKLILWEEAGSFKDILQAWQIARPSVEEDGVAYGLMIAFGTGGDDSNRFDGLKEMFYNPSGYNIKAFDNIWDEGAIGSTCGFFVPVYANMSVLNEDGSRMFMDYHGNTMKDKALGYVMSERKKVLDGATDARAIDRYVAENPITPQEACLELTGNIFPKKELQTQLSMIRTNKKLQNHKQVGDLIWVNGELTWQQKKKGDIVKYPLGKDDDTTGSIVIWEHPMKDAPSGLYIGGNDPYDFDKAENSTSLGSTFIYKRFQGFEEYYDIIVAEYTGRPNTADEHYENVMKLLIYYNARLLYENEKKGLFTYFANKHRDYLLADQPDIINDIIGKSTVNRRKGIHMTKEIIAYSEILIKDWLNEEYEPGRKNLSRILSEPLLEELIQYNDKGNFDRVRALQCLMIYRQQLYNMTVKKKEQEEKSNRLFDVPLFSKAWFETSSENNKSIFNL